MPFNFLTKPRQVAALAPDILTVVRTNAVARLAGVTFEGVVIYQVYNDMKPKNTRKDLLIALPPQMLKR